MRELIIIIIILIMIFGSALLIQNNLNKDTDEIVSKLEELKINVQTNEIEKEILKQKANEIYGEWKDINEKWSTLVLHDEMDLIETAFIRVKAKIEIGDVEESLEDIETSIFLLKHIKEKEKTSLKNIF